MLRTDTGRTKYFTGTVNDDGTSMTITGEFPTGGKWLTNNELINQEYTQPQFNIPELTFIVL